MACIESEEENDALARFVSDHSTRHTFGSGDGEDEGTATSGGWIGLYYPGRRHEHWNGSRISISWCDSTYRNWLPGKPSDPDARWGQRAALLPTGKWIDLNRTTELSCICQLLLPAPHPPWTVPATPPSIPTLSSTTPPALPPAWLMDYGPVLFLVSIWALSCFLTTYGCISCLCTLMFRRRARQLLERTAAEELAIVNAVLDLPICTYLASRPASAPNAEADRCAVCLMDFVDDDSIRTLSNCDHMYARGPLCFLALLPS